MVLAVRASQTRAVLSIDPETIFVPSYENAADVASPS